MAVNPRPALSVPRLAGLVLMGALAGCGSPSSSPQARPSSPATPSARSGFGAAARPSPVVSVVDEENFQSPSRNITCDLTAGSVRCEIVHRDWEPPPRPANCQLGWGQGMSISDGRADFVCAGDTVIGTASTILPYGSSVRAGSVQCDSGNSALRCVDQKSQHGFTLSVADYNLF